MKLSVIAFALAAAILWSLAMLMVNTANMMFPEYGSEFLAVVSSIYPGYETGLGIRSIVVGSLYALVDAGIAGLVFAWIYNLFAKG